MTDEGSAPPPPEPAIAPTPEAVPTEPAPAPVSEPVIESHTSSPASEARDPASEPSSSGLATGTQPSLTILQPSAPESHPEPPAAAPDASSPSPTPQPAPKKSAKGHMLTVVRARKAGRLEKIMALARERKVITNDDVQKLLTVTDTTATNYLNELVKAARLKRTGFRAAARYEPV